MKKFYISCPVFLCLLTPSAFADDWPIFKSPDMQLLQNSNYLTSNGCPTGEARLTTASTIKMNHNCQGYCPSNWEWLARSDGLCHQLYDINFIGYQIRHYPDENDWDFSVVTATYGSKASGRVYFEYVLTTPPGELWYCTYMEKQNWVSCANDY